MPPLDTHYGKPPVCGKVIDPDSKILPALTPKQTNCVDCAYVMITDSETARDMDRWMERYQELRKAARYAIQKQKDAELRERIRVTPTIVPKSQQVRGYFQPSSDLALPNNAMAGTRFRYQQPIRRHQFESFDKQLEWLDYTEDYTEWRHQVGQFLAGRSVAADLWYPAMPGETCTQKVKQWWFQVDGEGILLESHTCGKPAVESTTDQFGLPIARCEDSHIPANTKHPRWYDFNDYTQIPTDYPDDEPIIARPTYGSMQASGRGFVRRYLAAWE